MVSGGGDSQPLSARTVAPQGIRAHLPTLCSLALQPLAFSLSSAAARPFCTVCTSYLYPETKSDAGARNLCTRLGPKVDVP